MGKKHQTIVQMCLAAVMTAIVFVFTAYLHVPTHTGYTHVGDAFIYLAACFLPLPYGIFVGAGGALLADCLTGFAIWAPASVVIKAATVFCFSRKGERIISIRNLIGMVPAWALCMGGYYLYEVIITGNFITPLAGIPGYIMQCGLSSVVFVLVGLALDKCKFKTNILGKK